MLAVLMESIIGFCIGIFALLTICALDEHKRTASELNQSDDEIEKISNGISRHVESMD